MKFRSSLLISLFPMRLPTFDEFIYFISYIPLSTLSSTCYYLKKVYLSTSSSKHLPLASIGLTHLSIYSIAIVSITIMVFFYCVDYSNTSQMILLLNEFKRFDFFLDIQSLTIKRILSAMNQIIIDDTTSVVILMKKTNFDKQII